MLHFYCNASRPKHRIIFVRAHALLHEYVPFQNGTLRCNFRATVEVVGHVRNVLLLLSLELKLKIENLGRPTPILDIKQLVACKSGQYIEFSSAKCAIICYVSILKSVPVVQWLSYSPLDPRFAGSFPAGVDGCFQSVKTLSMTSFGKEVKPWVPCRRFTAHKRTSSRN